MAEQTSTNIVLKDADDLKKILYANYMAQIKNFFGDEKKALRFLSSVMASVQKNKKLLECTGESVINSFMMIAQLGLMPSDVSGEAYVLPYANNRKEGDKWIKVYEAQFQLGYQGHITLLYGAGVQSIVCEIVRKNDKFSFINGKITHEIDIFKSNAERGEAIGAYMIATVNGQPVCKTMNAKDILAMGKRFSKSFDTDFSPWKEKNDPELWMWKKTVLKQASKLLPKNEKLLIATKWDNEADSLLQKVEEAEIEDESLKMGNLVKLPSVKVHPDNEQNTKKIDKRPKEEPGLETINLDSEDNKDPGPAEE